MTEKFVKETEAMVMDSRHLADERAHAALREASEVKAAADALSKEAMSELKMHPSIESPPAAPAPEAPASRPPAPVAAAPRATPRLQHLKKLQPPAPQADADDIALLQMSRM